MLSRSISRRKSRKPPPPRAVLRVELLEDRNLLDANLAGADGAMLLVRYHPNAVEQGLVRPAFEGTAIGSALPLVDGLFEVYVSPGVDVNLALAAYQADVNVAHAEIDVLLFVDWIPNDTMFTQLWGLHNTGQNGGRVDADIDAPEAWDVTTGSRSIIVAVIDTGVDYNHPDLTVNMWRNPREIAGNGIDDDGNGFVDDIYGADFHNNDANPFDDNGHGTHVAGTIGAAGNNSLGVIGVSPNVQIMALKFLGANGSGSTSSAIKAIDYAVANGAKIINASWGGGGGAQGDALYLAIQRAQNAGVLFVAAAGNSTSNNDVYASWPANYNLANVISVAATDRNDNLASFSNYGATTVDLGAPGVAIVSTTPGGNYASYSGTSMATPHVAGAAALVWAANPSWTYLQVKDRLLATVDPLASLQGKTLTGGRLNVGSAVAGSGTTTPPPADTTGARVISSTWLTQESGLYGLRVTFSESIASFTAADVVVTDPRGEAITGVSVARVNGTQNQFDITFATQTAAGTYNVTLGPNVTDNAGNRMDQDQDGVNGEATQDQYRVSYTIQTSGVFTYSANNVNAPIYDRSSTTSSLFVDQNIRISDLNVIFNINHTYDGDLQIYLTSPDGTSYLLVNRRGGSGDNFINTNLDDEATVKISSGKAPFTGSFKPDKALSGYDNKLAYGVWTLRVYDAARGDVGTLVSWSLVITGQVVPFGSKTRGVGAFAEASALAEWAADAGLFSTLDLSQSARHALLAPAPVASASSDAVPVASHAFLATSGIAELLSLPGDDRDVDLLFSSLSEQPELLGELLDEAVSEAAWWSEESIV